MRDVNGGLRDPAAADGSHPSDRLRPHSTLADWLDAGRDLAKEGERLAQIAVDEGKIAVRERVAKVGGAVARGLAMAVVAVIALILLLVGIAAGCADLLDLPAWAGQAIVGTVVLLALWIHGSVSSRRALEKRLAELKRKYEPVASATPCPPDPSDPSVRARRGVPPENSHV